MRTPPPSHPAQDGMQGDVRYHGYHHGTSGAGMIDVEDAEGITIGVVRHVVVDSPTGLSWASSDPGLRTLPAACCSPPSTRTRGVGLAAAPGTSPRTTPTPSGRVPPARPRSRVRTAIGATGTCPTGSSRLTTWPTGASSGASPDNRFWPGSPPTVAADSTSYARNPQPHPWRSHRLCSRHPPSCSHHAGRIHPHSLPILDPCMWLLATCCWFS